MTRLHAYTTQYRENLVLVVMLVLECKTSLLLTAQAHRHCRKLLGCPAKLSTKLNTHTFPVYFFLYLYRKIDV